MEDDRDLARLIQVTLRPWTDLFHVAYDGVHGLDLIRRQRPDLILLDLNLPGLNGWDLYAAIQADPALRETPVIVLSANPDENGSEFSASRLERIAAYVVKPFTLTTLRETLRPFFAL